MSESHKIKAGEIKLHLSKSPDCKEAVLSDGTVSVEANMEVEAVTVPARKFVAIAKQIATLEVQNALLENQLQKLSYFTDPHAKGAIGRFLTADEIIREWASRAARFDEQVESLERQNALLRPVGEAAKLFGNKAVLFPGYYTISFQYGDNLLAATQAAIDGGAMGEG